MAEIGNVTFRIDAVITDEQYHEAMIAVSAANERMAELQAENAKLLELVKDIDEVAVPFLLEFIGRRMRELGIEAPDV